MRENWYLKKIFKFSQNVSLESQHLQIFKFWLKMLRSQRSKKVLKSQNVNRESQHLKIFDFFLAETFKVLAFSTYVLLSTLISETVTERHFLKWLFTKFPIVTVTELRRTAFKVTLPKTCPKVIACTFALITGVFLRLLKILHNSFSVEKIGDQYLIFSILFFNF